MAENFDLMPDLTIWKDNETRIIRAASELAAGKQQLLLDCHDMPWAALAANIKPSLPKEKLRHAYINYYSVWDTGQKRWKEMVLAAQNLSKNPGDAANTLTYSDALLSSFKLARKTQGNVGGGNKKHIQKKDIAQTEQFANEQALLNRGENDAATALRPLREMNAKRALRSSGVEVKIPGRKSSLFEESEAEYAEDDAGAADAVETEDNLRKDSKKRKRDAFESEDSQQLSSRADEDVFEVTDDEPLQVMEPKKKQVKPVKSSSPWGKKIGYNRGTAAEPFWEELVGDFKRKRWGFPLLPNVINIVREQFVNRRVKISIVYGPPETLIKIEDSITKSLAKIAPPAGSLANNSAVVLPRPTIQVGHLGKIPEQISFFLPPEVTADRVPDVYTDAQYRYVFVEADLVDKQGELVYH